MATPGRGTIWHPNPTDRMSSSATATFTCDICNAHFYHKSSLTRHKVLCEFKCQTEKNVQTEIDRFCNLPNHAKLVDIVRELVVRQTKTEAQLKELSQWVSQKKRRFDALKWLRANRLPALRYSEWIQHEWGGSSSSSTTPAPDPADLDEEIAELAAEPIWKIVLKHIQPVLDASIAPTTTPSSAFPAAPILPIACFAHNPSAFYVYEPAPTMRDWRRMEFADFVSLLKKIQNRLLNQLIQWKTTVHSHDFHTSRGVADLFNKASSKITGMRLEPDANWSKVRGKMAETIKIDIGLASAINALCDDDNNNTDDTTTPHTF